MYANVELNQLADIDDNGAQLAAARKRRSIYEANLPSRLAEAVNKFLVNASAIDLTDEIAIARGMLSTAMDKYNAACSLPSATEQDNKLREYAILEAELRVVTWLDNVADISAKYARFFKQTNNQFNFINGLTEIDGVIEQAKFTPAMAVTDMHNTVPQRPQHIPTLDVTANVISIREAS